MKYFVGLIAVVALILLSILAMDAVGGGTMLEWLQQNSGPPASGSRY